MKVFVVQKISAIGGSERYLLKLLPALRREGVHVIFGFIYDGAFSREMQLILDEFNESNVPVVKFCVSRVPRISQIRSFANHIREENYDLIHSHLLVTDFICVLAKMIYVKDMVIVSTKHGYNEWYNNKNGFAVNKKDKRFYRFLASVTEKKVDRSFAVSKAIADLYVNLGICCRENLDVIYHGFDYPHVENNMSLRKSHFQIIIAGRLTAFKGHRFGIEAMSTVTSKYPDAHLIIVGDGIERSNLELQIQSLDLGENVSLLGFVPNVREYMSSSDIVLIPSVSEAFGLVFLEAMSCKRAIICFDAPAGNEILEKDVTGIFVEKYDAKKMGEEIIKLFDNREKMHEIGSRAYMVQKQNYNLSVMVENTILFYDNVLKKHIPND